MRYIACEIILEVIQGKMWVRELNSKVRNSKYFYLITEVIGRNGQRKINKVLFQNNNLSVVYKVK